MNLTIRIRPIAAIGDCAYVTNSSSGARKAPVFIFGATPSADAGGPEA